MGNAQHANLCLVNRRAAQPIDLSRVKYLTLGIGSIRGVALLGAYERLLALGLPTPQGTAGSSVGCIVGLGITLGLTVPEIQKFLDQFLQKSDEFKFKLELHLFV